MGCCPFKWRKYIQKGNEQLKNNESVITIAHNHHSNKRQDIQKRMFFHQTKVATIDLGEIYDQDTRQHQKSSQKQHNSEQICKNQSIEDLKKLNSEPVVKKNKVYINQNNRRLQRQCVKQKYSKGQSIQTMDYQEQQLQFIEVLDRSKYPIQKQSSTYLEDCQILWQFYRIKKQNKEQKQSINDEEKQIQDMQIIVYEVEN